MPIEFACEDCGSVLRVPDGSSGKRSRCPTCRHEQEIPWVVSDSDQVAVSDKLSIPCPKCQHHLVCSPELLGKRGRCKKCQHIFTISTQPKVADASAPALVFHCPECDQLFEGNESMRGRKGKCHMCKAVFEIKLELAQPQPKGSATSASAPATQAATPATKPAAPHGTSPKPTSSSPAAASPREAEADRNPRRSAPPNTPTQALPKPAASSTSQSTWNDEDELLIIDEDPAPAPVSKPKPAPTTTPTPKPKPQPASSAPIRFECQQCRGVMEVPGSTAGLETECPYCQTVQVIPAISTVASTAPAPQAAQAPAASYANSIYGNQSAPSSAGYDPLGSLDFSTPGFGAANPYAAPAPTWTAPATQSYSSSGRASVSVGNVLQLGFNSLFPSCLVFLLHSFIVTIVIVMMYALLFGVVYALRESRDIALYAGFGMLIMLVVVIGLMSAWMAGAMSRTALDAVRNKPFNLGDSLNPAGAFGSSIMVVGGGILLALLMYAPMILHATTGALKGLEFLMIGWIMLFIPIMIVYGFGTSLALFAGADGESSIESLQTSMRLVFRNIGTALAVLLISGMISGLMAVFTFGLSYVVPIYMTAALYHLASKQAR